MAPARAHGPGTGQVLGAGEVGVDHRGAGGQQQSSQGTSAFSSLKSSRIAWTPRTPHELRLTLGIGQQHPHRDQLNDALCVMTSGRSSI